MLGMYFPIREKWNDRRLSQALDPPSLPALPVHACHHISKTSFYLDVLRWVRYAWGGYKKWERNSREKAQNVE